MFQACHVFVSLLEMDVCVSTENRKTMTIEPQVKIVDVILLVLFCKNC